MPQFEKPVVGNFCWVEANLQDPARAKSFYTELFGWKAQEMPMPQGTYTMFKLEQDTVAGMMQLPEQAKKMGAPPHWLNYVAVEDTPRATKRAEGLGAKVLLAPMKAGPGTMSVIQDPTGGVLALWSTTESMGTFLWGEPNSLCWSELATTDAAVATNFYTELFGWSSESWPMGDFNYTVLKNGELMVGGLMPQPSQMAGAPSAWMAYFAVADCDASAKRATSLGAILIVPPTDIPNVGRFAAIQDPDGAVFSVIKNLPR